MLRRLNQTIFLLLLLGAFSGTAYLYHEHTGSESQVRRDLAAERQRNEELTKHNEELKSFVSRLKADRRAADILVTDQQESAGIMRTKLLFIEYARDGVTPLPPKEFWIEGKSAYIDAMVIEFDGKFVEQNDALRGQSIGLFTRIFDETRSPKQADAIDPDGLPPDFYRNSDQKVEPFEKNLWANFWRLADDPKYRESMGVRVAQRQAVGRNFDKNSKYRLTLDANGGMNINQEPVPPIYLEALKRSALRMETGPTTKP